MAMSSRLTALTTPRIELDFVDVTYDPDLRYEASELVVRSLDPFMEDRGIDTFRASNSRLVVAAL